MSILMFFAALLAIFIVAIVVNRLTGTNANYLDALKLDAGETELWRDEGADFYIAPRLGRALIMSYMRVRRHTVVWMDRRVIVASKALFSTRRMITHQIYFVGAPGAGGTDAGATAREYSGGFYGRGFQTIVAQSQSFGQADNKDCVRINPTEECGATQNIREALIFSDHLAALQGRLESMHP
jgi:hypothetical protein